MSHRLLRSLLVVVGCVVSVTACSSKSSSSGSGSTSGGGSNNNGTASGSGSKADCGAACSSVVTCGLSVTDANGNPLDEAGCTPQCEATESLWAIASCVKGAADCNAAQTCMSGGSSGGGSSGGGSCIGEGQACDPVSPNCCTGAPVCCQGTGTCTFVGNCNGGS